MFFRLVSKYPSILFLCVLVAILQGISCKGTSSSAKTPQVNTLGKIIKEGKIRAGYFIEPPAVMKNPNTGELSGTFVESIKFIASQLKVEVEFVEVDLAKFAAGLQNYSYDVSIGPTFKTIPRAANCSFARTIFYLGYTGVVLRGNANRFRTEADINQHGVTVAVKDGSAIHRYALDNFKKAKVIVLAGTDLSLPLQAVSSGNAMVGLMNEHTVEFYFRQHPEVEIVLADNPIQISGMSWAVRADDQIWLDFLNTSLEFLEATGMMANWERRYYFGKTLRHSIPTY